MDREAFEEIENVEDRDEEYAQGRVNQLIRLHLEVHAADLENFQNQRAEEREIREQALVQLRKSLVQQYRVGALTLKIQRVAAETKNRKVVNTMIVGVKNISEELTQFSTRALEVLDATPAQYAVIPQARKSRTKTLLIQVSEKLSTINLKMNDIEELLNRFEINDATISGICRQIKRENSSFCRVIVFLKRDLDFGEIGIRNREEFKDYGMRLYQMINCMKLISEERIAVVETIQASFNEAMPNMENLSIEN